MKTTAIIVLLVISISSFAQETKITRYESIYNTCDSKLHYTLLLSDNHKFFIYGGGTYQWDMIYSTKAFYGTYRECNDTLKFDYMPLDSILIATEDGYYSKLAFYQDTIWIEKQKEYSSSIVSCIKKNDKITFSIPESGFLTRRNLIFIETEEPISYSFSIKGLLPVEFHQYVSSPEFSFEKTLADIYIAQYPDSISSIDVMRLDNSILDSFSVSLTNYKSPSYVFVYPDKQFDLFVPQKVSLDSLTSSGINSITLRYTSKHGIDWQYLNKNIPSHWQTPPRIVGNCLILDEYGKSIDVDKKIKKLRYKIKKRSFDISYVEAYKLLLKSNYFNGKELKFLIKDSLPSKPIVIFNALEIFGIKDLSEIYNSFYETSDSLFYNTKIKKYATLDNSSVPYYISKAGFSKNKTICFVHVKTQDVVASEEMILVFERRLNQYVLTGKIEKGKYHDELPGNKCDYFQDMRNYRLFY